MSLLIILPFLITFVGAYFLVKLRFFFVAHPINTLRKLKEAMRVPTTKKSLALALAGTLGVGNIVGVAYGISVGGAGSLFWMLVSGLFASVIKYAEITLAKDMKCDGSGGMSQVLKSSFKTHGVTLSRCYALLCLSLSLVMGAALQSQSAVYSAEATSTLSPHLVALSVTLLTALVVVGGAKKIESATAFIIPIATLLYTLICVVVILKNRERLPDAFGEILRGAFDFKSIGAGVSSFLAVSALKEGFLRGLLSNEAGAGTSSMAIVRSSLAPAEAGLLGICEVFFDTVLLCTLTGLTVLVANPSTVGRSGIDIVSGAISSVLGGGARFVLFFLVFSFAYATVICWYYYGRESLSFVFGGKGGRIFTPLFVGAVFFGFLLPEALLINTTDYILFLMSVLTLSALIKNSERIRDLSEQCGLLKLKKSDVRKRCKAERGHGGKL